MKEKSSEYKCKTMGFNVVGGEFSERFPSNNPQRWVRNAFSWVLKEGTKNVDSL